MCKNITKIRINGKVGALLKDLEMIKSKHGADDIMDELSSKSPYAYAAIGSIVSHINDILVFWEGIVESDGADG